MNFCTDGIDCPTSVADASVPVCVDSIEGPVYAVQDYVIGAQLQSIPPYYLPSGFTDSWYPTTWNNFRPLDSPIAVSVKPTLNLQVWPRLAWEQLKNALHEYSYDTDVEMPVGSNSVLQLACDYLGVTAGGIFPVSFATIVSTSKFFDWIQPLAKRIRSLARFARKGIVLYGRNPFLISSHEKVSAETAARQHTTHIEDIDLARAHSSVNSSKRGSQLLDSGRVGVCNRFLFTCLAKFFGRSSPKLSVCFGVIPAAVT
jgi:hypothetical protein